MQRGETKEDLSSAGSLPKWPQWPKLSQSEARKLFQVSYVGAGSQAFGPSLTAFPGHKQGGAWEAGSRGLELVPIWDAACSRRGLKLLTLSCLGPFLFFFLSF